MDFVNIFREEPRLKKTQKHSVKKIEEKRRDETKISKEKKNKICLNN